MSGLEPVGETVIIGSSYRSKRAAYHTEECENAKRIGSRREVDRSVAEWLGCDECHACKRIRGVADE